MNTKPREYLRKFSPARAGPAYVELYKKAVNNIRAIQAFYLIKGYKVYLGLGPGQRGISRTAFPVGVKVWVFINLFYISRANKFLKIFGTMFVMSVRVKFTN